MANSTQRYDWKRFWCPREGSIALEREGFLMDPDELPSKYVRTDAVTFDAIKAVPCLLLLGEPGIGKTDAMEVASNEVKASLPLGEEHLHVDCRIHRKLEKFLFSDPRFATWRDNKTILHLFIDSLDEHPDPGAASEILGELSLGPIDKLRLRIACRTAQIPPILEAELRKRWGKTAGGQEQFGVYELTPLRKKDVAEAAKADGLKAEEFLSAVQNRGATALAIKPVTLKFLLNMFRVNRALPKNRWEIYEEGCRKLCDENSKSRKSNQATGKLSWSQRLAIAGRIAAACVLGNRSTIYLDSDPGDLAADTLLSELLAGKLERAQEKDFDVDEAEVQETLTMTGLFNERGKNQLLGWAHQTYAEFLTARFLRERGFRLGDLAGILYPGAGRIQIVPALREVAAWLASTDIEIFRQLIDQDPQTLLQSDVAMVDDIERKMLVDALLDSFAHRRLIDEYVGGRRVYRKLWHSGLTEQLESWIRGKDRDWMARRAAIDIAEACNVQALQDVLADVALDPTDSVNTRVEAVHAVVEIGDGQTLVRLRPLAHGQVGDDPNDELRGLVLSALWPKYMSAQDMFQCLVEPKRTGFFGRYRSFIGQLETECKLADQDLVHALHWVGQLPAQRTAIDTFHRLSRQIVRQSWEQFDNLSVLTAMVKLAEIKYHRHEHLFNLRADNDELSPDDDTRRKKFLLLFAQMTQPMVREYWALHIDKLLMPYDIPWLIGQLDRCSSSTVRVRLAAWIASALCHKGFILESIEAILDAWPRHSELRQALQWLEPVELGSPLEAELRKQHAKDQQWLAQMERHRVEEHEHLLDPPPAERILRSLDRFEQGNIDAFWQMQLEMWLRPTSTHYEDCDEADLSKSPGWQDAPVATRDRMLAAAKRYISVRGSNPKQWLGKNEYPHSVHTGYRAFFLLFTQAPQLLETLPYSVWQRWAAAIIGYPKAFHDSAAMDTHRRLVHSTYRNAPTEMLAALTTVINFESRKNECSFVIREIFYCWDMRLGTVLLDKLRDPSLKPSFFGSLLDELLKHEVAGAAEYATSLLIPLPKRGKRRARARFAAQGLFRQFADASWPVLERVFREDPAFGHNVALQAAARIDTFSRRELLWSNMSERQLAEFFLWLEEQFPHNEDRNLLTGKGHIITPRDSVADVRKSVLKTLSQRGTQQAVNAIRHIEHTFGAEDWIRFVRIEAEQYALAGTRRLLSPAEVIDLRPRTKAEAISKETTTMGKVSRLVERCDVLLMTATEIETIAVLDAARAATQRDPSIVFGENRTYHDLGEIGRAHIYLVSAVKQGSETPGGSMSTALNAIGELGPQSIVMVGVAFGVNPEKQLIGRVLYSHQLQCYGPVRIGTDPQTGTRIDIPRGDKPSPAPWLLDRFNTAKLSWSEGGSEGCEGCLVLSGPALVDNIDYREALQALFPEAQGGEMEGAGLYGAAAEKGVPWIVVKAICDYADGNKHENKAERQKLAAARAASFVFHAIAQGGFAPRSSTDERQCRYKSVTQGSAGAT